MKPRLPTGAQAAVRLLRENPNGYTECYGTYELNHRRCALGLLGWGEQVEQSKFNISDWGVVNIWQDFDGDSLTFSQMADMMEAQPERYFDLS